MPFNTGDATGLLSGGLIYIGITLVACWVAMIVWTYRDMRSRSRDRLAPVIVAVLVAALTIPGLLMYLFLRPRETLADAYERSLEEEALLQEIEDKPVCPGCKQRVRPEWQACPECHTRLKRPCARCGQMLELAWDICPYCASAQPTYNLDRPAPAATATSSHVRPSSQAAIDDVVTPTRRSRSRRSSSESLEFVEGDDS